MDISTRQIAYVVNGEILHGQPPETNAGFRYNAIIPAREIGAIVITFDSKQSPESLFLGNDWRALVIVKPTNNAFVEVAKRARARGIKVVFHCSDWHFNEPVARQMNGLADAVVVQTQAISTFVQIYFKRKPIIIEEPYEGPRLEPRFSPAKVLKVLWYGHGNNLDTLPDAYRHLGRVKGQRFEFTVITNNIPLAHNNLRAAVQPLDHINIKIEDFGLERLATAIRDCHLVLIPSKMTEPKVVKGHNRLVQAIHAGRMAIAFPLPQYQELADYCWCGEDLAEGILWALEHPADCVARVTAGQRYIDTRFAPSVVGQRWRVALESVLSAALVAA